MKGEVDAQMKEQVFGREGESSLTGDGEINRTLEGAGGNVTAQAEPRLFEIAVRLHGAVGVGREIRVGRGGIGAGPAIRAGVLDNAGAEVFAFLARLIAEAE